MQLKDVKKFLKNIDQDKIEFDSHFYKRMRQRPVNESMVRSFLSKPDRLEKIEEGRKERFKAWFKMSRKYSLAVIIEIDESTKVLKVISAWNSNRKWQSRLRQ